MSLKKVMVCILCCIMIIITAACSDASVSSDTNETKSEKSGEGDIGGVVSAGIEPDLPEKNYNGETVTFLVKLEGSESSPGQWTSADIYVEEMTGEPINDARYERNRIIEEKYNIKIAESSMAMGGQATGTMYNGISTLVMAGDTTYDIVMPTLEDSAKLSAGG